MSEEILNQEETTTVDVKDVKDSAAEAVVEVEEKAVEKPVAADEKVDAIVIPKSDEVSKPGLGSVGDGALGSTTVVTKKSEKAPAKKLEAKAETKEETVAVFSTRNATWNGVGKVYNGYNIITKEASEKWLKRDHIRLATPDEIAREFGL